MDADGYVGGGGGGGGGGGLVSVGNIWLTILYISLVHVGFLCNVEVTPAYIHVYIIIAVSKGYCRKSMVWSKHTARCVYSFAWNTHLL